MIAALMRSAMAACLLGISLVSALPQSARAQDASVKSLVTAYNAAGQQLFKQFAAGHGNIVFSPYSINTAMAMALAGARGATATQMAKALKMQLPRADMDTANAAILATLNGYDHSAETPTCPENLRWTGQRCETAPGADGRCPFMSHRDGAQCVADPSRRAPSAQLRVANALMQAKSLDLVTKEYIDLLKQDYGADVLQGASVSDVNDWVKRKTEGKIDKIVDQMPDVVLLNAIYFKARWESTFAKGATENKPFHISLKQSAQVPTMAQTADYSVVARENYRAIRLPYDVGALGMIVVLPNKIDGVGRVAAQMNADELSKLAAALRTAPRKLVALELPRFKTAYATGDLSGVFRKFGMTNAFDRHKADFSGITGQPPTKLPFWIDAILHRAVIDVMEDGTEAAAVTAIAMATASMPQKRPEPEIFHVDRPFLFYIVDNGSGAVLFQGRISDPR